MVHCSFNIVDVSGIWGSLPENFRLKIVLSHVILDKKMPFNKARDGKLNSFHNLDKGNLEKG